MTKLIKNTEQDQVPLLKKKILYLETELSAYKTQLLDSQTLPGEYDNFIANFNHELLTPLNSILGLLELSLEMPAVAPKLREYLVQAQSSCQQLKKVAGNAVSLTQLDNEQLKLKQLDFNLHNVFEQLISHYVKAAAAKKIDLNIIIPAHLPYNLIGDPLRLQQILGHLLENAIKFSETGEIILSVKVLSQKKQKIRLQFSVKDSGIGISNQLQEDIFKPFFQTDSTSSRKYSGTGIGLSLCKHLVTLMQGKITVSSQIGQGSQFTFDVCFRQQTNITQSQYQLPRKGNPWKSLVIDAGNKSVHNAIKPLMEDFQFEVDFLHTSTEAINTFQQNKECHQSYDLLIVDWEVLERKFEPLVEAIANCSQYTQTIVLIPFGLSRYLDEYQNISINKFVKKPITKQGLFKALVEIFTESKTAFPDSDRIPPISPKTENFSATENSTLQKHLKKLAVLLEHGDHIEAEKLVTELQNLSQDHLLKLLHYQISEFDFDEALDTVLKLKNKWL